jgi:transposase InsO family protein
MDFVGPFPPSHGFDYLWVIVDKLTSMVRLVPTTTRVTAKELAKLFLDQVWKFHGLPNAIISDRDSKFVSRFWREVYQLLGTKLLMSTAYHPQTDGSSERAIRTVSSILRAFVSSDQTDWSDKLPQAEFAINSTVSVTTGHTPFELNYGYTPSSLRLVATEVSFPGVRAFAEQARVNLMRAHDAIIESLNSVYQLLATRGEDPVQGGRLSLPLNREPDATER